MALTPMIQLYTSDPTISGSNPTGYILTDHNRQSMNISYEVIENAARMANGTMRKFITANKKNMSTSWQDLPSAAGYPFTSDSNLGAAFIKSFYEENVYNPVWVKFSYSAEAWQFANTVNASSVFSMNQTFNSTSKNTAIANSLAVKTISFSTFAAGVATASITTTVPHGISAASSVPEFYLSGINQVFNGTWIIDSVPSSSVIAFKFNSANNPAATFKLNSYVQTTTTASFNVDNTDFIKVGNVLTVSNSKNTLGSSINGDWTITAISGPTIFTASSASSSQTGRGFYGDIAIKTTSASYSNSSLSYPAYVGPVVASDIIKVFMSDFTYDIKKRFQFTDIVDISIKFTEI
jgi:hypothetical protein